MITTKKSRVKRSKVESNPAKKKTFKTKMVASSDSKYDAEVDVLDIASSTRKNVDGRKILANVPDAPFDNMSFHT